MVAQKKEVSRKDSRPGNSPVMNALWYILTRWAMGFNRKMNGACGATTSSG